MNATLKEFENMPTLNKMLRNSIEIQKKDNSLARQYSREWLNQYINQFNTLSPAQLAHVQAAIKVLQQEDLNFAAGILIKFYNLA